MRTNNEKRVPADTHFSITLEQRDQMPAQRLTGTLGTSTDATSTSTPLDLRF
jgi:hypothetical protein